MKLKDFKSVYTVFFIKRIYIKYQVYKEEKMIQHYLLANWRLFSVTEDISFFLWVDRDRQHMLDKKKTNNKDNLGIISMMVGWFDG